MMGLMPGFLRGENWPQPDSFPTCGVIQHDKAAQLYTPARQDAGQTALTWCHDSQRPRSLGNGYMGIYGYEESIPAGRHRRTDFAYRSARTSVPAALGKDGCGADDGALFRSAGHGLRTTQSTPHFDRQVDGAVRKADLHERKAIFEGRRCAVHAASAPVLGSAVSLRLEPRDVQSYGSSLETIRRAILGDCRC
jgi:hypothetical protein